LQYVRDSYRIEGSTEEVQNMDHRTTEREYLTVEEAADRIGVHPQTVRRWLRAGQMLGTLISRTAGYRIPRDEVERVLEEGLREGKLAA
jgi:excisionase family DNA binding protein